MDFLIKFLSVSDHDDLIRFHIRDVVWDLANLMLTNYPLSLTNLLSGDHATASSNPLRI